MGLMSTIPPMGGMNFLKRLRYGSTSFENTFCMSRNVLLDDGTHDMMT